MKNWIIRKLGGITFKEYTEDINKIRKENFEKIIDSRTRGGQTIAVICKKGYQNSLETLIKKIGINRVNITKVNKLTHTITLYNGTQFKIFSSKDENFNKGLKGANFFGYIYI